MRDVEEKIDNRELDLINSNLIPIRCHYDRDAILTSNCELFKLIEITHTIDSSTSDIRGMIRKAMDELFGPSEISVYVYVVRDEEDVSIKPCSVNDRWEEMEKKWNEHYKWGKTLRNKLYIAFCHSAGKASLSESNMLSRALGFMMRGALEKQLKSAYAELTKFVKDFCFEIESLKPRALSIAKNNDGSYVSEIASVMYRIFHLQDKEILLEDVDLALSLSDSLRWNSSDNDFTLRGSKGTSHAAIFTLKNLYSISRHNVESLLMTECTSTVLEVIRSVPASLAAKEWQEADEIYRTSGAVEMREISRLDELLSNNGQGKKYCSTQTNFILYATSAEDLTHAVKKFVNGARKIGLQFIREDIAAQSILCSQIPGNLPYATRTLFNLVKNSAAFAVPYFSNTGNAYGSKWGEPIVVFKDIKRCLPYYFNFHLGKSSLPSHCLVIGDGSSSCSDLSMVLALKSMRNKARVITIDINSSFARIADFSKSPEVQYGETGLRLNIIRLLNDLGEEVIHSIFDSVIDKSFSQDPECKNAFYDALKDAKSRQSEWDGIFDDVRKQAQEKLDAGENITSTCRKLWTFLASEKTKKYLGTDKQEVLMSNLSHESGTYLCFDDGIAKDDERFLMFAAFLSSKLIFEHLSHNKSGRTLLLCNSLDKLCLSLDMEKSIISSMERDSGEDFVMISCIESLESFGKQSNKKLLLEHFDNKFFFTKRHVDKQAARSAGLTQRDVKLLRAFSKFPRSFMLKNGENVLLSDLMNDIW